MTKYVRIPAMLDKQSCSLILDLDEERVAPLVLVFWHVHLASEALRKALEDAVGSVCPVVGSSVHVEFRAPDGSFYIAREPCLRAEILDSLEELAVEPLRDVEVVFDADDIPTVLRAGDSVILAENLQRALDFAFRENALDQDRLLEKVQLLHSSLPKKESSSVYVNVPSFYVISTTQASD